MGDSLSQWVSNNQLLMSLVILPLVSFVIASFTSWYAVRRGISSARAQRNYEATAILSGFRQKKIEDLRNDLAEHQAICMATKMTGKKDLTLEEKNYRLAELANRILLSVDPDDPDCSALSTALAAERLSISIDNVKNPETVTIAQKILKREWETLKSDFKSDALSLEILK